MKLKMLKKMKMMKKKRSRDEMIICIVLFEIV